MIFCPYCKCETIKESLDAYYCGYCDELILIHRLGRPAKIETIPKWVTLVKEERERRLEVSG